MNYRELKIVVLLKRNINVKDCGYKLSTMLSGAMAKDEELLNYHNTNTFKLYSYDNLYPLAKNGVYAENNLYSFRLRSVNIPFINKLKMNLYNFQDDNVKVIMIDDKTYRQRKIVELLSLTPIISTLEKNEDGLDVDSLANLQDNIINTLVKKYNLHTGENLTFEDAAHIFTTSKPSSKPISINYKNISLLGIKYRLNVGQDSVSQNLAFFAEAVGLGEKCSSCGAGFCHATYDKGGKKND